MKTYLRTIPKISPSVIFECKINIKINIRGIKVRFHIKMDNLFDVYCKNNVYSFDNIIQISILNNILFLLSKIK